MTASASPRRSTWPLLLLLLLAIPLVLTYFLRQDALPAPPPHPLDPLTEQELALAVEILRQEQDLGEHTRFPYMTLQEPSKELMREYEPGDRVPRQAFAVVYDYKANRTHEAVVDLGERKVLRFEERPGVQPMILGEEYELVTDLVRHDERIGAALKKRDLTPDEVQVDLWAPGPLTLPDQPANARLCRAVLYSNHKATQGYNQPIEGLTAVANLNTRAIIDVQDRGVIPPGERPIDLFQPDELGPPRPGLKPLALSQPEGPSFQVRGHEVRWQNWSFRFANDQREGLVLHQVAYDDQGRRRPILHRASLAELVVPYGDPDRDWNWRAAFDEGEYGLGQMSFALEPGHDVPAYARLFPSTFVGARGQPVTIPNSVALYERDGGLLWKHRDMIGGKNQARRARELVLTQAVTAGNYDYGLNWVFGQDGQIKVEIELTGIMQARGVKAATCQRCADLLQNPGRPTDPKTADQPGTLVAANVIAPHHQHFFCFRLDFDIDGPRNSIAEMNVRQPADAPETMVVEETVLATEQQACRDLGPAGNRRWKIFNPEVKTTLGHFAGYTLEPGPNSRSLVAPDSPTGRRAGFLAHSLWVTRYRPDELFPAGPYPNQDKGGDGLPRYVQGNEKIVGSDLVVWYTVGATHVARPEEWPVMPVARSGFRLVPDGFFTRNPALDVPAGKK